MPGPTLQRRNGPYVPLSAFYADDDAVLALEAACDDLAELLFLRGMAYCARDTRLDGYVSRIKLTTGKLIRRPLPKLNRAAAALVEVGLWTLEGDGWRIRQWAKWNRTHAEIENTRAKDRRRKSTGHDDEPPMPPEPGDEHFPPDSERNPAGSPTDSTGFPARARAATTTTPAEAETPQHNGSSSDTGNPWSTPLPPPLEDLKATLTAAGLAVEWNLDPAEVALVLADLERAGISALANYAKRRHRNDSPAFSAKAWLAGWHALPGRPVLAAAPDPIPCDHGTPDGRLCALCRTERRTA